MKNQPHRLPAEARHGFGGSAIDRKHPLSFRVNGIAYDAFEGDTVLSALLASGVDTAGQHLGEAIALDADCGPQVALARESGNPAAALPMDRTPVLAGLDLVTVGPRIDPRPQRGIGARLASLITPRSRSLGHRLDDPRIVGGPWLAAAPSETLETDTLVVGGGIAGMTAALAAAAAGERVMLLERRLALGGDARFFGTVGEEAAPEATIAALTDKIAATAGITVLNGTEGMVLAGTRLRAHQVRTTGGRLESRVLAVHARRVVLATGAAERLPVFPGNRMPGVVGALEAFQRAERYGIWRSGRALFATPHNFAYRLALLAADAGITVTRVADTRPAPQSRFVDFCKASGITLAAGLVPRSVEALRGGEGLSVGFAVAIEYAGGDAATVTTDLLVAAGGWQPRLALWLMAGGGSRYDERQRWLAATGELEDIALAGSAAGWRSSTACLASAEAAVAGLLGRKAGPIEEYEVDAIYESKPAPTPLAPWRAGRIAFLDRGHGFTPCPHAESRQAQAMQPVQMGTLGLGDVAAFVEVGAIRVEDAGIIAAERCLTGGDIEDSGWRVTRAPADADTVPVYLRGLFGAKPQVVVVRAGDARRFEVGCRLYPSSGASDPDAAIGVVIGPAPDGQPGAQVLADRAALGAASALFVRDTSGAVAVTVAAKP